jgi:hypothetical protein
MTLAPLATEMDIEKLAESGLGSMASASTMVPSCGDNPEGSLSPSASSAAAKGESQLELRLSSSSSGDLTDCIKKMKCE